MTNKGRKTSHIVNIVQYDANGHVVLPATLTVGENPHSSDNTNKIPSTSWVRTYVTGLGYQSVLTLTTTGSSGAATLVSNTLNVPTYTLSGLGGEPAITAGTTSQYWRGDKSWQTLNTTAVAEGTNLYYTTARVNSDFDTRLATKSTTNLAEGTNLYYTDARVGTYLTNNSYATQTYVNTAVSNLVDAAPGTLDTLNELAAALGDDPNFATTVATSIGTKEPAITAGTTSQYWRGDKTWQTLPVYTLSGLGGVPTTRSLTINGTAYDLSADRSWTINSMVYPGAGIPVSTGTAWGTSITDNSANWNTAYGWGNHASAGYLTSYSETSTLANVTARGATTSTAITITTALGLLVQASSEATIRLNNTGGGTEWRFNSYTNGNLYFQSAAGATNAVYFTSAGAITGASFIKSGGTSSQFLKADGSVDSSTYLTSYTETDTLATVTGRGASTSTNLTFNGTLTMGTSGTQYIRMGRFPNSITNSGEAWIGRASDRGAGTMTVQLGTATGEYFEVVDYAWTTVIFRAGMNSFVYKGNNVYHAGNLTNLNQLTNGPGYITSYTETDTLASVTGRGASTSTAVTFNGGVVATSVRSGTSTSNIVKFSSGANSATFGNSLGANSTDTSRTVFFRGASSTASVWWGGPDANGDNIPHGAIDSLSTGGLTHWYNSAGTGGGTWTKIMTVDNNGITANSGNFIGNLTGNAATATNVAWTGVTGRPTNVSSFTNDSGYITSSATITGGADRIQTGNNQWTWTNGAHTASSANTITLWDQYSNNGGAGYPWTYGTIVDIYGRSGHEHDQLFFNSDGQIFHRNCFYGTNTWNGWRTMWDSSNLTNLNQLSNGPGYITSSGSISGNAATATSATQVVTIQDSAPSGASGKLWWESDTGKLKVYYGSAWVDASPIPDSSLFFAKAGGSITGDVSIGQTLNVVGNTLVQGNINAFGDITAYSSSDARLKDNITPIDSPLEKLSKINGVSFNWNDKQSVYQAGTKDYGVIAQEVEEVLPELVTTRDTGYKAVRYEKIVSLLIEAIKEQQTQINKLTDKLNKL